MFNKILQQVTENNKINKTALFELAAQIKDSNLKDENVIRGLIRQVSQIANKDISQETEDYLVERIKTEGIPANLTSLFK